MWEGIIYFLKMCWNYNKKYIVALALNQIVKVCLILISLFFPQAILDAIFTNKEIKLSIVYIITMVVLNFLLNSLGQILTRYSNNARTKTFHFFQIDLANRMMSAKLEKIESQDFLSLKAKAEQYLYGGGQGFASILESSFDILGMLLSLLLYGTIISQLHISVLLLLTAIIIVNIKMNYYYQKKTISINLEKAVQERKTAYYSGIFQDFSYGKEIRANDLREWLLDKYNAQLDKMQFFYKSLNKNNFMYSILSLGISVIQQLISYGYLLLQTINNNISVGVFSLYLNTIISFNSTIKSMVNLVVTVRQYTIYYASYKKYISVEDIFEDNFSDVYCSREDEIIIQFKNVSFKYPYNDFYSLKNVNSLIRKGDRVAIVGKNGAGKSTYIKLLLRIYQPTDGIILLNGKDINSIPYIEYLKMFSTVFQDYKLFAQSIKENIMFDRNNSDKKLLDEILQEVGLYEKINSLHQGINTTIYKTFDNDGYVPSEGEAQKIAFARAIYRDAPIVILDEPSSSLDPQSEFELYGIFDNMAKSKTCLYISHRLAISAFCNKIIVFDNGNLIEEGDHESLMKEKGLYYSLYNMQAKYYDKAN